MKHLLLINPAKRKKHMALRSRRRTRTTSRRRAHRNKPLSAAHKRKISLAIKRRNAGGKSRKSSTRRVKVRRSSVRTLARRSSRRSVARRSSRRSVSRRRGGSRMGGFLNRQAIGIKSLFNKDTLTIAGGAVGATFLSSYVLLNWGSKLPGATNPLGIAVYRTGIGLGGAILAQRFNRKLAEGMLIGTAVMIINDALSYVMRQTAGGTAAGYYRQTVGGNLSGRRLASAPTNGARAFTPGYQGSSTFGNALSNQSAFPASAWAN